MTKYAKVKKICRCCQDVFICINVFICITVGTVYLKLYTNSTEMVHTKFVTQNLSLFTHPCIVPNPNNHLYIYFKQCSGRPFPSK